MAQEKVQVVVEVRGGCVQAIYAGNFVEVVVVDWDNDEEDRAAVYALDSEGCMSEETAALAEAARQEWADLLALMAYGNQIGHIVGRAVTPGEARPFHSTGYTPQAAAYAIQGGKTICAGCGYPVQVCACIPVGDGQEAHQ